MRMKNENEFYSMRMRMSIQNDNDYYRMRMSFTE